MSQKEYKSEIPHDLKKHAIQLYTKFGINIVIEHDERGKSLTLHVPYYFGQGRMCCYEIKKQGKSVRVRILGTRFVKLRLTEKQKRTFFTLFSQIDKIRIQPVEAQSGPHKIVVCT